MATLLFNCWNSKQQHCSKRKTKVGVAADYQNKRCKHTEEQMPVCVLDRWAYSFPKVTSRLLKKAAVPTYVSFQLWRYIKSNIPAASICAASATPEQFKPWMRAILQHWVQTPHRPHSRSFPLVKLKRDNLPKFKIKGGKKSKEAQDSKAKLNQNSSISFTT